MTTTTNQLPDLLVRTTARGDRFGWRLVTLDGHSFLTSVQQADTDASPADYDTRAEAREAAGAVLIALVLSQPSIAEGEGKVVEMRVPMGASRLVA